MVSENVQVLEYVHSVLLHSLSYSMWPVPEVSLNKTETTSMFMQCAFEQSHTCVQCFNVVGVLLVFFVLSVHCRGVISDTSQIDEHTVRVCVLLYDFLQYLLLIPGGCLGTDPTIFLSTVAIYLPIFQLYFLQHQLLPYLPLPLLPIFLNTNTFLTLLRSYLLNVFCSV